MSSEIVPKLKIGDFSQVKGGKRMPAGTALVSSKTNHPYLRIVDFREGSIDKSNLQYVPDEVFPSISRYTISTDDLYISIVGTIGLVGKVPLELNGANLTENAAKICQIDNSLVDSDYLGYFLCSEEGQRLISSMAVGSTQPKLALFRIEQIEVPCPALEIQKSISQTLRALDDRITLLRETNTTLEAIAQALFKSWFVDFDPVHAQQQGRAPEGMDAQTAALFPDSFEESELGMVPKGWRVGTLGDIAQTIKKQISSEQLHSGLNYVGLEHIPRKSLSLTAWDNAEGLESAKAKFGVGDVLFGKLRPYFHKVVIAPVDGVCSTDILVCSSKKPAYYGLVAMQLFSKELIDFADRLSNGAKMPRVNWSDLAAYPLAIPPEEIASSYTKFSQEIFGKMQQGVHQMQTLAKLRDTLLPRLISGQLRLPEAQAQLESVDV